MKKLLQCTFLALIAATSATAQITIDATDMPATGDSLLYSIANPAAGSQNYSSTGAAFTWDFSTLVPVSQVRDVYRSALSVNVAYTTISPSAYGFKVADSLPGAPVPVTEIYNFFNKKTSPSRFIIEGFAAKVSGFPTPVPYSDEDEVYFFPLTSTRAQDSSTFKLTYNSPLGYFSQQGYRLTKVDGYGTIMTPYTTGPVAVLRVRSEIVEVDSFNVFGMGQKIPRNTVEYKWLAKSEHYPLLNITTTKAGGNETISGVRYRDTKRAGLLGVSNVNSVFSVFQATPNPALGGVTVQVPASWKAYSLRVFDATGKVVASYSNTPTIATENLAAGSYIITAECAGVTGVARFVK